MRKNEDWNLSGRALLYGEGWVDVIEYSSKDIEELAVIV
jgi:hypothetical protein